MMRSSFALAVTCCLTSTALAADGTLQILEVIGAAEVKGPAEKSFRALAQGAEISSGSRIKTPAGARVRARFPDGTETVVEQESDAVLEIGQADAPSSTSLFLGRIWAKVTRATKDKSSFEVHSANAVAGVRGTVLEVGVALDGSTRVVVDEGKVAVDGEEGFTNVSAGQLAEATSSGRVGKAAPAPEDRDWSGWFSARAKKMEAEGLAVAKSLNGRLKSRKAHLKKLLDEQKQLRKEIQALERSKKDSDRPRLERKLAQLERVTARLKSMRARLEGAFALFQTWSGASKSLKDGPAIAAMAEDVEKVAAEFADMIEEGTDMSEESMDEMMDDMKHGKTDRPDPKSMDDFLNEPKGR
ncbi:MAG: FecR domain-containing protein [Deltaproteobacteria bacterium]|nr:FecR domain-containing protein [Deltaproteobacteria bacterium]